MALIRQGRQTLFQPQRAANVSEQYEAYIGFIGQVREDLGSAQSSLFATREAANIKKGKEQAEAEGAGTRTSERPSSDLDEEGNTTTTTHVVPPELKSSALDSFLGPSATARGYNEQATNQYIQQQKLTGAKVISDLAIQHEGDPEAFLAAAEAYRVSTSEQALPGVRTTVDLGLQSQILKEGTKLNAQKVTKDRQVSRDIALDNVTTSANAVISQAEVTGRASETFRQQLNDLNLAVGLAMQDGHIDPSKAKQIFRAVDLNSASSEIARQWREFGSKDRDKFWKKILDGDVEMPALQAEPNGLGVRVTAGTAKLKQIMSPEERRTFVANLKEIYNTEEFAKKMLHQTELNMITTRLLNLSAQEFLGTTEGEKMDAVQERQQLWKQLQEITGGERPEVLSSFLTTVKQQLTSQGQFNVASVKTDAAVSFLTKNPQAQQVATQLGIWDDFENHRMAIQSLGPDAPPGMVLPHQKAIIAIRQQVTTAAAGSEKKAIYAAHRAEELRRREAARQAFIDQAGDDPRERNERAIIWDANNERRVVPPEGGTAIHDDYEEQQFRDFMEARTGEVYTGMNDSLSEHAIAYVANRAKFGYLPPSLAQWMKETALQPGNTEALNSAIEMYRVAKANPNLGFKLMDKSNLGTDGDVAYGFLADRYTPNSPQAENILQRARELLNPDVEEGDVVRITASQAEKVIREHAQDMLDGKQGGLLSGTSSMDKRMLDDVIRNYRFIAPQYRKAGSNGWQQRAVEAALNLTSQSWHQTSLSFTNAGQQEAATFQENIVTWAKRPIEVVYNVDKDNETLQETVRLDLEDAHWNGEKLTDEQKESLVLGDTLFFSASPSAVRDASGKLVTTYQYLVRQKDPQTGIHIGVPVTDELGNPLYINPQDLTPNRELEKRRYEGIRESINQGDVDEIKNLEQNILQGKGIL